MDIISGNITGQIAGALKAGDKVRLSVLRMLLSALNYERIEKQHDLNREEELAVVRREAKKRRDAIEVYEKLRSSKDPGVQEVIGREKEELAILKEYLPEEISESELVSIVDQVVGETDTMGIMDMGRVMGEVMRRAKGEVDSRKVAGLVRDKLSEP